MPRVNINADAYAAARLNIFFPAHNQTPADGNLTGQCVTLNKWFLSEMTDVPAPFAARGDARYVGDSLVNQGHAVEVAYSDRRRGDFVVYKYGVYGHIGVLLSGDRIFEQNVNVPGVARRIVDGAYVYASRIGSLGESWRPVRPNIYRIKSYKEGNMPTLIDEEGVRILAVGVLNRPEPLTTTPDLKSHIGGDALAKIKEFWYSPEGKAANKWQQAAPQVIANQAAAIDNLNKSVAARSGRPTRETLAAVQKAADEANAAKEALQAAYGALQEQVKADEQTGNAFMRWLGDQLNKILGKG